MPNYGRTAYYLDTEAIRVAVAAEVALRHLSYTEIGEQTGVLPAGIGRFLDPQKKAVLHHDGMITLIKWAGLDIKSFIKRRRTISRHTDTFEQRKLRQGAEFLKEQGVPLEQGESSVDALLRLLAEAKRNGFLA